MEQKKISDTIEQLLDNLAKVYKGYKTIDIRAVTENFMNGILDIYLAWKTNSSIEKDPKFQAFIHNSSSQVSQLTNDINQFISDMEYTLSLTFYSDEWDRICWKRSSIEALKEIYQNTLFEEYLILLDTEDVDGYIEGRKDIKGYIPFEDIPKGIPPSHWWWYPDTPIKKASLWESNR